MSDPRREYVIVETVTEPGRGPRENLVCRPGDTAFELPGDVLFTQEEAIWVAAAYARPGANCYGQRSTYRVVKASDLEQERERPEDGQ